MKRPAKRNTSDELSLLIYGRLATSYDLAGGSDAPLFSGAAAHIRSLQEQIDRFEDPEDEDPPTLTPEEIAEIKAEDERYLASLSPVERALVLSLREAYVRRRLIGSGEGHEPRGLSCG